MSLSKKLGRDESGVSAVEFGLIAPVFLMMLMGFFDLGYNVYAKSILQGAMQEAARTSTIEGATVASLDTRIKSSVQTVLPRANLSFDRRAYSNFSEVRQAEDFDDDNGNGLCDNGELFEDTNDNGVWDSDRGVSGQGEAREAVLYTATMTYQRAFPIAGFIGLSNTFTTSETTVLRNQPFSLQPERAETGNC